MLPLLANASAATRTSAIHSLGTIWVDADFPLMFRIYTKDSERGVRREAAWVLRRRASSANWRTLFVGFYVDELARHRMWACELAGSFSGPEILPALSALSLDIDGHVRKAASRGANDFSTSITFYLLTFTSLYPMGYNKCLKCSRPMSSTAGFQISRMRKPEPELLHA
ncbi:MAG: HEAT repeat domain-containing protein [Bradyrhizobium sp.]|nr:HEAT repeat domain-containing protein [Bradyrhizobium sp.]